VTGPVRHYNVRLRSQMTRKNYLTVQLKTATSGCVWSQSESATIWRTKADCSLSVDSVTDLWFWIFEILCDCMLISNTFQGKILISNHFQRDDFDFDCILHYKGFYPSLYTRIAQPHQANVSIGTSAKHLQTTKTACRVVFLRKPHLHPRRHRFFRERK